MGLDGAAGVGQLHVGAAARGVRPRAGRRQLRPRRARRHRSQGCRRRPALRSTRRQRRHESGTNGRSPTVTSPRQSPRVPSAPWRLHGETLVNQVTLNYADNGNPLLPVSERPSTLGGTDVSWVRRLCGWWCWAQSLARPEPSSLNARLGVAGEARAETRPEPGDHERQALLEPLVVGPDIPRPPASAGRAMRAPPRTAAPAPRDGFPSPSQTASPARRPRCRRSGPARTARGLGGRQARPPRTAAVDGGGLGRRPVARHHSGARRRAASRPAPPWPARPPSPTRFSGRRLGPRLGMPARTWPRRQAEQALLLPRR